MPRSRWRRRLRRSLTTRRRTRTRTCSFSRSTTSTVTSRQSTTLGQSIPGTIQIGQTKNPTTGAIVNRPCAGGVEYLSQKVKELRTANTNTISVGAGDLSAQARSCPELFHDEPAIEALNILGIDVCGIGNHEFDEGLGEVYRMMNGGCHPVDGCQDGTPFFGSTFGYLAANVFFAGTDDTVLPPYEIRKIDNAKIAFIGMTLEGTPLVVIPRRSRASSSAMRSRLRTSSSRSSARSRACGRS